VEGKPPERPEVLARWSRLPIPAGSPAPSAAERDRIIDVVVGTMRSSKIRTPVRHRLAVRAGLGVAAAGLLMAVIAVAHYRLPKDALLGPLYARSNHGDAGVHGRESATPSELSSARAPGSSSQIATDRLTSSRLQLASGVQIVVGPETHLGLPGEEDALHLREEVVLESGILQVRVPKLPKGATFAIRTPNAVVSVHGTAFSVAVTNTGPSEVPQTRVTVTEGVVSVEHAGREILLDAGTEWTSAVASSPAASADLRLSGERGFLPTAASGVQQAGGGPATSPGRVSTREVRGAIGAISDPTELADQNRLFLEAMSARDRGARARAVALLDEFIVRYPACPLTEDAHVARFRVLSQSDRGAAAKAARRYLVLYPEGLASQEARALALAAGPVPSESKSP